jgi:hypothetical protein
MQLSALQRSFSSRHEVTLQPFCYDSHSVAKHSYSLQIYAVRGPVLLRVAGVTRHNALPKSTAC